MSNNFTKTSKLGKNRGQSRVWLAKLHEKAEQGDAEAQFNLGYRYYYGGGVPQDYVEALKWYRLAAEQGHAEAQFDLGIMYDNGQGVPKDYAEAAKWYRLAADQGYAKAQAMANECMGKMEGTEYDN